MKPSSSPVLFVPESAPFSPEQRAWLNGFLAGILARENAGAAPAAPTPGRPLSVLFGSQTGTAERLARRAAKLAQERGFSAAALDMGTTAAGKLTDTENVLVITSTYGDGEPPDNAKTLFAELAAGGADLSRVSYSVCGLGDTNYARFCQAGKDVDAYLEKCGARRAAPRADCDVDYEKPFDAWLEAALAALGGGLAADPPARAAPTESRSEAYGRTRPFPAPLLASAVLNGAGSDKEVRHVAFSLRGSGLTYEAGDALGVQAHNCPELVAEILALIRCDGEEEVQLADGTALPFRKALSERCELGKPTPELLARLAGPAPGDERAGPPLHLVDLLRLRPEAHLAPAELARLLRPLAPRLYSISSSPTAHAGEVHLTVGVVRYAAHGRGRKGVCSTFLAERVTAANSTVPVFVHSNPAFRLPSDPAVPIIMIGPGTGIAPFRAFLHERRAVGARGRTWLFFGDRHAASDFLYADELAGFQRDGTLTRLDTAFSRDQEAKRYVQHRLEEHAAEVFAWLEDGAKLYVCGDAARMARDVDTALHAVVERAGGKSADAARAYVQALRAAKRYLRDVY